MLCNVVGAHLGGGSTITTTNTSITKPNNCTTYNSTSRGVYSKHTLGKSKKYNSLWRGGGEFVKMVMNMEKKIIRLVGGPSRESQDQGFKLS
jgi:hypothetical protein